MASWIGGNPTNDEMEVVMKILPILTLTLFIFTQASRADIIVTTKDGRDAILHDNGKWEFIKGRATNSENIAISIEDFYKTHLPVNFGIGRYYDEIQLTLFLRNNTDKTIKTWRAMLNVRNQYDKLLIKSQLTSGLLSIKPGQIENSDFTWKDNQFIDGELYDRLIDYDPANLRLSLTDIETIH